MQTKPVGAYPNEHLNLEDIEEAGQIHASIIKVNYVNQFKVNRL